MNITFLGAVQYVTGLCHLMEVNGFKQLLDCGLIQGSSEQTQKNYQDFPLDPASIDADVRKDIKSSGSPFNLPNLTMTPSTDNSMA